MAGVKLGETNDVRLFENCWWLRLAPEVDRALMRGEYPESMTQWPSDVPEDWRAPMFNLAGALAIVRHNLSLMPDSEHKTLALADLAMCAQNSRSALQRAVQGAPLEETDDDPSEFL